MPRTRLPKKPYSGTSLRLIRQLRKPASISACTETLWWSLTSSAQTYAQPIPCELFITRSPRTRLALRSVESKNVSKSRLRSQQEKSRFAFRQPLLNIGLNFSLPHTFANEPAVSPSHCVSVNREPICCQYTIVDVAPNMPMHRPGINSALVSCASGPAGDGRRWASVMEGGQMSSPHGRHCVFVLNRARCGQGIHPEQAHS